MSDIKFLCHVLISLIKAEKYESKETIAKSAKEGSSVLRKIYSNSTLKTIIFFIKDCKVDSIKIGFKRGKYISFVKL